MPKYSVVLFDMDGTIADTDEMVVQSFYVLFDKYRKNGERTSREQLYKYSGPPINESLENEFPNEDIPKLIQEFKVISYPLYDKYVKGYPYCKELCLHLKEKGIKIGVVTSKLHQMAIHCNDVIDMGGDLFECLVAADDVSKVKPDPEGIIKGMELLGETDSKKVLYIGDNTTDYDAAVSAGVDCAMVHFGPRDLEEYVKPAYDIYSFKDFEKELFDE